MRPCIRCGCGSEAGISQELLLSEKAIIEQLLSLPFKQKKSKNQVQSFHPLLGVSGMFVAHTEHYQLPIETHVDLVKTRRIVATVDIPDTLSGIGGSQG